MTLRARTLDASGAPLAEMLVDDAICDCCQTDAATTARGVVVVYRNRTEGEVRDIYTTSLVDGRWTEGRPVHEDGWVIPACPVNGPAVDARGDDVAVAWFSAPATRPACRSPSRATAARRSARPRASMPATRAAAWTSRCSPTARRRSCGSSGTARARRSACAGPAGRRPRRARPGRGVERRARERLPAHGTGRERAARLRLDRRLGQSSVVRVARARTDALPALAR
jgi:hypothetical protein